MMSAAARASFPQVPSADALGRWVAELVRIPSVTPMQDGPKARGAGEVRIGAFVAERFEALGGEVHVDEVFPGRPNVFGIWRGKSGRWLGVDVHMDTVGVEQMTEDPFDGRIEQGRVFGRGSADTKATLGVCLALLERLRADGARLGDNLLIAATSDEEGSACGAPACAKWLRDHGIVLDELAVAEPTRCAPVYGHKGVLRLIFEIEGKAAHSSTPALGKNAVMEGARLAIAFGEEHERLQREHPNSPLGLPALTVTVLQGGLGVNIVPPLCRLTIDRRVVSGEKASELAERYLAMAQQVVSLPLKMQTVHAIDAFHRSPEAPFVQRMAEWSGLKPAIAPYCTNAWAYPEVAKQCLVIGPGSIDQAHGAVEWVEISELQKLAGMFARWWGTA